MTVAMCSDNDGFMFVKYVSSSLALSLSIPTQSFRLYVYVYVCVYVFIHCMQSTLCPP